MKEKWKDITGYEGIYQISNLGNVRSLDRIVKRGNSFCPKKGQILKTEFTIKGYRRIQLQKDNGYKHYFVHVLVANEFIGLPKNSRMQVNHKNHNREDNRVQNLEWTTPSQNVKHAYTRIDRIPSARYIITCVELNFSTLGMEKMVSQLRDMGYEVNSGGISRCIHKKGQTHGDLSFISERIQYDKFNSRFREFPTNLGTIQR